MKRHILFSIFMTLILLGCSSPTSPSSQNSATIAYLSGQIDAWNYGSNRHIVLSTSDASNVVRINSTSKIDLTGRFSLQNLTSPPASVKGFPSYFLLYAFGEEILENTLACSDSSSIIINGELRVGNDSTSYWLGLVNRESGGVNWLEKSGDFIVKYWYATKDVKLSGTIKVRNQAGPDSTRLEQIFQYDLFFARGWSQEVYSLVSQRVYIDSGKTITSIVYSYTNYEPYQGKWIYSGN